MITVLLILLAVLICNEGCLRNRTGEIILAVNRSKLKCTEIPMRNPERDPKAINVLQREEQAIVLRKLCTVIQQPIILKHTYERID